MTKRCSRRPYLSLLGSALLVACSSSASDRPAPDAAQPDTRPAADSAPSDPVPGDAAKPSDATVPDLAPANDAAKATDAAKPSDGAKQSDGSSSDAAPPDDAAPKPDTANTLPASDTGKAAEAPSPDTSRAPDGASADALPIVDVGSAAETAACVQASFTHLSPIELETLLDSGEDPFLINVKGSSIKNIPGTDAVLANDVAGIESLVKRDLCANIVLYCRSGATSQSVGSQLIADGYKHVRDLAGGITAWQDAGYPTM